MKRRVQVKTNLLVAEMKDRNNRRLFAAGAGGTVAPPRVIRSKVTTKK